MHELGSFLASFPRSVFGAWTPHTLALCLAGLWTAPLAGAETIDFDRYPGGAEVPPGATIGSQWMSLGVVFSDVSGGAVGASNNSCSLSPPNHAFAGTIVARFVDPVTGSPALTEYAGTAQVNRPRIPEGSTP